MSIELVLEQLLIFFIGSIILIPIGNKLKIEPLVSYLILGLILGSFLKDSVSNPKDIIHFAELGVVFFMFLIGLKLSPSLLWQMKYKVFVIGGLQVGLTLMLIYALLSYLFNLHWLVSFIISASFTFSSTAILLKYLNDNDQLHNRKGNTALAILLFQDICVIPFLILVEIGNPDYNLPIINFLYLFIWIVILAFIGKRITDYIFHWILKSKSEELFTLFALIVVIGSSYTIYVLGFSMTLGAFLAGVMLANSSYCRQIEVDIEPFKSILLGIFFISLGMFIDINFLINNIIYIVPTAIALMLVKTIIIATISKLYKFTLVSSITIGIWLAQSGEFSFVLLNYAIANELINYTIQQYVLSLVSITMLLTIFLNTYIDKINEKILNISSNINDKQYNIYTAENKILNIEDNAKPIILIGIGRFGQIIHRILQQFKIEVLVFDDDYEKVKEYRKAGHTAWYGGFNNFGIIDKMGIDNASAVILAIDTGEISLSLAKQIRKKYPNSKIFSRVYDRNSYIQMKNLNVDFIVRETFYSSITLAKNLLKTLNYDKKNIDKVINNFVDSDLCLLNKQADATEKVSIEFSHKVPEQLRKIINIKASKQEHSAEIASKIGKKKSK